MSIESGRRRRNWNVKDDPVIQQARLLAVRDEDQFIQNFLTIKTNHATLDLLRFKHGQRQVSKYIKLFEKLRRPIRFYILKSRQIGMSTYCAAKTFARCYRQDNTNAMIMGHRKDRTAKLLLMAHLFHGQLPTPIQPPLSKASTDCIRFPWNSELSIITGGSPNASRSSSNLIVHASEVAFYDDLFGTMGSIEQTVAFIPESMIFMETTGNGAGTPAHIHWESAGTIAPDGTLKHGDNAYFKIFLPVHEDPECQLPPFKNMMVQSAYLEKIFYDFPELKGRMEHYGMNARQIGWYYEMLKFKCYGDELYMQQEYPCDAEEAWVASGTPVFPVQLLAAYRMQSRDGLLYAPVKDFTGLNELKEDPNADRKEDKYLEVWQPPTPHGRYLIGADGAAGFADGDYSSAFVLDRKTLNICAELHGRFEPDEFAHMLGSLGRTYNNAIVAPETNGVGLAVLASLQQFYWQIYFWRMIDSFGLKITNRLGWDTNSSSRPIMITEGKRLFKDRARFPEQMGAFLPSKALIDELRTFSVMGLSGKPQAQPGCHDDRVMAWLIALICTLQEEYGKVGDDALGGVNQPSDSLKTSTTRLKMQDVMDEVLKLDW